MDAVELIQNLAIELDCSLDFVSGGHVAIEVDDQYLINIEHDEEQDILYLYTSLGPPPPDPVVRFALTVQFMKANSFDPVTNIATISLNLDGTAFIYISKKYVTTAAVEDLLLAMEYLSEYSPSLRNMLAEAHGIRSDDLMSKSTGLTNEQSLVQFMKV